MNHNIPDNPNRTASPYCAPGEHEPPEDERFVFMEQTKDQKFSLVCEWLLGLALEDTDIAIRELNEAVCNALGAKHEMTYLLNDLGKRFCDDAADEWRFDHASE